MTKGRIRLLQVDRHYLTLWKEACIRSQPPGIHILEVLRAQHPELWKVEAPFTPPKSVHRLDALASGVMIFARSHRSARLLSRQFHDRKVHKTYVAQTGIIPMVQSGTCRWPIDGKEAITEWSHKGNGVLNLHPLTGRKHQCRIHCMRLGHSILGDRIYGGGEWMGEGIALSCTRMVCSLGLREIVVS